MRLRRLIYLVLLGMIAGAALGQPSNPGLYFVSSAPSGSCTNGSPLQVVISTGALYSCQSGTWATISGGGGGVTSVATTSPITGGTITTTGDSALATWVTSAASLTSNQVVIGGGGQATSTIDFPETLIIPAANC